jgi:hypothetical protein
MKKGEFLSKHFNKELKSIGILPEDVRNSLFNCLNSIKEDISPEHYKLIFNKNHPSYKK